MARKRKNPNPGPFDSIPEIQFDRQFDNQSPIQRQIAGRRGWMKPRQKRKELEAYKFKRPT